MMHSDGKLETPPRDATAEQTSPSSVDLPNFRVVTPGLFRGGQPTLAGLETLRKLGVKTIVCLRDVGAVTRIEGEQAESMGMHFHKIPLKNLVKPTREQIDRILAILDDPRNLPVYVHCRRGCDRTGTVIACYRVMKEDWAADKAVDEALELGMARLEYRKRRFIRDFRKARQLVGASVSP